MSSSGTRPYLSIGEVLELLKDEFPEVSISRIRVFESHGLLQLERTASGYRKFYDADVTHLRSILREQGAGDGALARPASVGLAGSRPARTVDRSPVTANAAASERGAAVADSSDDGADDEHVDLHSGALPGEPERRHPASFATVRRSQGSRTPRSGPAGETNKVSKASLLPAVSASGPAVESVVEPVVESVVESVVEPVVESVVESESVPLVIDDDGPRLALVTPPVAPIVPVASTRSEPLGSRNPLASNPSALSLTLDELCRSAGITTEQERELEGYGLIRGHAVFSTTYYDEDALLTCRLVAEFAKYGVEPRHLRMYKLAADREAAFFEQVVTPQLRRRNADAKDRAIETLGELVKLGEQMRVVALRQVLRAAVDPS